MTNQFGALLLSVVLLSSLVGCAGVMVGSAATSVSMVHDRRTVGTIIDDQSIEFKIYEKLDQNEAIKSQSHINVTSYNNAVLLSGEVPTPAMRQQVEEIARNIEKVKYVHNELMVGPPSTLGSRSSDTWITTKVKSSLLQIDSLPGFDPTRVKVVTERGIVYLFGLLTPAEADAVTSTVRRVGGVQKVIVLFEYIN